MPQPRTLWLQQLSVLEAAGASSDHSDALISTSGSLLALGAQAAAQARAQGLRPINASGMVLAPTLVDPHSVLEQPLLGRAETLSSLAAAAAGGGYGHVALLPWGDPPRDQPERLQLHWPEPQQLLLWASLSQQQGGQALSPHSELLAAGAIGLAAGADLPPLQLLQRSLQLGELGCAAMLLAPRSRELSGGGLVRERVQALRAGWPVDPDSSETLPLAALLNLQQAHPERRLVAMNVSTAAATVALATAPVPLQATVHWWHLLHDSGSLAPTALGWRIEPPLGGPADRQALIEGLESGLIAAVAVHHQPLDSEEQLLPIDQRKPGLAGHGPVLPLLWQALVGGRRWRPERLWQALCWGPAGLLGLEPPSLTPGCWRWLLFDPDASWCWHGAGSGSVAANQPLRDGAPLRGRIVASGLLPADRWTHSELAAAIKGVQAPEGPAENL
jgi:dihydroorotase